MMYVKCFEKQFFYRWALHFHTYLRKIAIKVMCLGVKSIVYDILNFSSRTLQVMTLKVGTVIVEPMLSSLFIFLLLFEYLPISH